MIISTWNIGWTYYIKIRIFEIFFFNITWEVFNIDYIKNITNSQNFITSDESTRGIASLTVNATPAAVVNTIVSRNSQGQFYGTLNLFWT